MKAILILSLVLASGVATAQQFDMRKAPAEPCATALATEIKRTDRIGVAVITYTAGGAKCTFAVSSTDTKPGTPDRIELGRLKTIAGHSGKPAK